MLPDLGKYAVPVLSAYAAMIVLILGIIIVSLQRARQSKATLEALEKKRKRHDRP